MHHSEHPEGGCDGWSRASARHTATAHSALAPDRYRQGDFFIADIQDVVPKGDLASMEHPLFALRPGDKRVRRYERNGLMVEVQPGAKGLATIHDKDVWIYCISQLVEGLNRGRGDPGRVVHFKAHSFLVATNRGTSGSSYSRLADSLERLRGTTIITNIETAGRRERHGFGLIDSFKIVERDPGDQRMVALEVTLPDWLHRSVQAKQVLTLSRSYFRIRRPLDRRIYELARKHCGAQSRWRVSLPVLHAKTGSTSAMPKFRMNVKALVAAGDLPDYRMVWDEAGDAVTFYSRAARGAKAHIVDVVRAGRARQRVMQQAPP